MARRFGDPGWDRDYLKILLNIINLQETLPEEYLNESRAERGETHSRVRISLFLFMTLQGFNKPGYRIIPPSSSPGLQGDG